MCIIEKLDMRITKRLFENGYVIVENFITPEKCDEIKHHFNLQNANYPVVLNLHRRSDFWKIISNSNLVNF